MKTTIITSILILVASIGFSQSIKNTGKKNETVTLKPGAEITLVDSTHYHFTEPDVILIDNLMGQLDQISGNSDRVSTSQYNQLHRAVMHVDSLIKAQYSKKHPIKERPKKSN